MLNQPLKPFGTLFSPLAVDAADKPAGPDEVEFINNINKLLALMCSAVFLAADPCESAEANRLAGEAEDVTRNIRNFKKFKEDDQEDDREQKIELPPMAKIGAMAADILRKDHIDNEAKSRLKLLWHLCVGAERDGLESAWFSEAGEEQQGLLAFILGAYHQLKIAPYEKEVKAIDADYVRLKIADGLALSEQDEAKVEADYKANVENITWPDYDRVLAEQKFCQRYRDAFDIEREKLLKQRRQPRAKVDAARGEACGIAALQYKKAMSLISRGHQEKIKAYNDALKDRVSPEQREAQKNRAIALIESKIKEFSAMKKSGLQENPVLARAIACLLDLYSAYFAEAFPEGEHKRDLENIREQARVITDADRQAAVISWSGCYTDEPLPEDIQRRFKALYSKDLWNDLIDNLHKDYVDDSLNAYKKALDTDKNKKLGLARLFLFRCHYYESVYGRLPDAFHAERVFIENKHFSNFWDKVWRTSPVAPDFGLDEDTRNQEKAYQQEIAREKEDLRARAREFSSTLSFSVNQYPPRSLPLIYALMQFIREIFQEPQIQDFSRDTSLAYRMDRFDLTAPQMLQSMLLSLEAQCRDRKDGAVLGNGFPLDFVDPALAMIGERITRTQLFTTKEQDAFVRCSQPDLFNPYHGFLFDNLKRMVATSEKFVFADDPFRISIESILKDGNEEQKNRLQALFTGKDRDLFPLNYYEPGFFLPVGWHIGEEVDWEDEAGKNLLSHLRRVSSCLIVINRQFEGFQQLQQEVKTVGLEALLANPMLLPSLDLSRSDRLLEELRTTLRVMASAGTSGLPAIPLERCEEILHEAHASYAGLADSIYKVLQPDMFQRDEDGNFTFAAYAEKIKVLRVFIDQHDSDGKRKEAINPVIFLRQELADKKRSAFYFQNRQALDTDRVNKLFDFCSAHASDAGQQQAIVFFHKLLTSPKQANAFNEKGLAHFDQWRSGKISVEELPEGAWRDLAVHTEALFQDVADTNEKFNWLTTVADNFLPKAVKVRNQNSKRLMQALMSQRLYAIHQEQDLKLAKDVCSLLSHVLQERPYLFSDIPPVTTPVEDKSRHRYAEIIAYVRWLSEYGVSAESRENIEETLNGYINAFDGAADTAYTELVFLISAWFPSAQKETLLANFAFKRLMRLFVENPGFQPFALLTPERASYATADEILFAEVRNNQAFITKVREFIDTQLKEEQIERLYNQRDKRYYLACKHLVQNVGTDEQRLRFMQYQLEKILPVFIRDTSEESRDQILEKLKKFIDGFYSNAEDQIGLKAQFSANLAETLERTIQLEKNVGSAFYYYFLFLKHGTRADAGKVLHALLGRHDLFNTADELLSILEEIFQTFKIYDWNEKAQALQTWIEAQATLDPSRRHPFAEAIREKFGSARISWPLIKQSLEEKIADAAQEDDLQLETIQTDILILRMERGYEEELKAKIEEWLEEKTDVFAPADEINAYYRRLALQCGSDRLRLKILKREWQQLCAVNPSQRPDSAERDFFEKVDSAYRAAEDSTTFLEQLKANTETGTESSTLQLFLDSLASSEISIHNHGDLELFQRLRGYINHNNLPELRELLQQGIKFNTDFGSQALQEYSARAVPETENIYGTGAGKWSPALQLLHTEEASPIQDSAARVQGENKQFALWLIDCLKNPTLQREYARKYQDIDKINKARLEDWINQHENNICYQDLKQIFAPEHLTEVLRSNVLFLEKITQYSHEDTQLYLKFLDRVLDSRIEAELSDTRDLQNQYERLSGEKQKKEQELKIYENKNFIQRFFSRGKGKKLSLEFDKLNQEVNRLDAELTKKNQHLRELQEVFQEFSLHQVLLSCLKDETHAYHTVRHEMNFLDTYAQNLAANNIDAARNSLKAFADYIASRHNETKTKERGKISALNIPENQKIIILEHKAVFRYIEDKIIRLIQQGLREDWDFASLKAIVEALPDFITDPNLLRQDPPKAIPVKAEGLFRQILDMDAAEHGDLVNFLAAKQNLLQDFILQSKRDCEASLDAVDILEEIANLFERESGERLVSWLDTARKDSVYVAIHDFLAAHKTESEQAHPVYRYFDLIGELLHPEAKLNPRYIEESLDKINKIRAEITLMQKIAQLRNSGDPADGIYTQLMNSLPESDFIDREYTAYWRGVIDELLSSGANPGVIRYFIEKNIATEAQQEKYANRVRANALSVRLQTLLREDRDWAPDASQTLEKFLQACQALDPELDPEKARREFASALEHMDPYHRSQLLEALKERLQSVLKTIQASRERAENPASEIIAGYSQECWYAIAQIYACCKGTGETEDLIEDIATEVTQCLSAIRKSSNSHSGWLSGNEENTASSYRGSPIGRKQNTTNTENPVTIAFFQQGLCFLQACGEAHELREAEQRVLDLPYYQYFRLGRDYHRDLNAAVLNRIGRMVASIPHEKLEHLLLLGRIEQDRPWVDQDITRRACLEQWLLFPLPDAARMDYLLLRDKMACELHNFAEYLGYGKEAIADITQIRDYMGRHQISCIADLPRDLPKNIADFCARYLGKDAPEEVANQPLAALLEASTALVNTGHAEPFTIALDGLLKILDRHREVFSAIRQLQLLQEYCESCIGQTAPPLFAPQQIRDWQERLSKLKAYPREILHSGTAVNYEQWRQAVQSLQEEMYTLPDYEAWADGYKESLALLSETEIQEKFKGKNAVYMKETYEAKRNEIQAKQSASAAETWLNERIQQIQSIAAQAQWIEERVKPGDDPAPRTRKTLRAELCLQTSDNDPLKAIAELQRYAGVAENEVGTALKETVGSISLDELNESAKASLSLYHYLDKLVKAMECGSFAMFRKSDFEFKLPEGKEEIFFLLSESQIKRLQDCLNSCQRAAPDNEELISGFRSVVAAAVKLSGLHDATAKLQQSSIEAVQKQLKHFWIGQQLWQIGRPDLTLDEKFADVNETLFTALSPQDMRDLDLLTPHIPGLLEQLKNAADDKPLQWDTVEKLAKLVEIGAPAESADAKRFFKQASASLAEAYQRRLVKRLSKYSREYGLSEISGELDKLIQEEAPYHGSLSVIANYGNPETKKVLQEAIQEISSEYSDFHNPSWSVGEVLEIKRKCYRLSQALEQDANQEYDEKSQKLLLDLEKNINLFLNVDTPSKAPPEDPGSINREDLMKSIQFEIEQLIAVGDSFYITRMAELVLPLQKMDCERVQAQAKLLELLKTDSVTVKRKPQKQQYSKNNILFKLWGQLPLNFREMGVYLETVHDHFFVPNEINILLQKNLTNMLAIPAELEKLMHGLKPLFPEGLELFYLRAALQPNRVGREVKQAYRPISVSLSEKIIQQQSISREIERMRKELDDLSQEQLNIQEQLAQAQQDLQAREKQCPKDLRTVLERKSEVLKKLKTEKLQQQYAEAEAYIKEQEAILDEEQAMLDEASAKQEEIKRLQARLQQENKHDSHKVREELQRLEASRGLPSDDLCKRRLILENKQKELRFKRTRLSPLAEKIDAITRAMREVDQLRKQFEQLEKVREDTKNLENGLKALQQKQTALTKAIKQHKDELIRLPETLESDYQNMFRGHRQLIADITSKVYAKGGSSREKLDQLVREWILAYDAFVHTKVEWVKQDVENPVHVALVRAAESEIEEEIINTGFGSEEYERLISEKEHRVNERIAEKLKLSDRYGPTIQAQIMTAMNLILADQQGKEGMNQSRIAASSPPAERKRSRTESMMIGSYIPRAEIQAQRETADLSDVGLGQSYLNPAAIKLLRDIGPGTSAAGPQGQVENEGVVRTRRAFT